MPQLANARHLATYGYVALTVPEIIPFIEPIFDGFKKVLAEPESFKERLKFHVKEQSLLPDHGLLPPKGGEYDEKWIFQYRKNYLQMVHSAHRATEKELAQHMQFFGKLKHLYDILVRKMLTLAEELDAFSSEYDMARQLEDPHLEHVVRLIKYLYRSNAVSDHLAAPHTDQSCITMQWYESHPGLVLIDYHGNRVEYEYKPGAVLVFFGKKIVPATSGALQPVRHYVDARAAGNRFAGIFFGHTNHPSIENR